MTVNPMQRRTRNSFLLGFLLAVLVSVVIIVVLVAMIRKATADLKAEKAKQKMLLVASVDINEFSEVTIGANVIRENTIVSINEPELITEADLDVTGKRILSKTKIPKGTVITKSMLIAEEEKDAHDLRLHEFNMLMLPSELKSQDVVDIRFSLPTGEDFIVVPKKVVEKADATSVWMKMTEDELLIFNNAVVEAYLIEGSKIYVVPYVHPGIQKVAAQTYPISGEAWNLISVDENITEKAIQALRSRINSTNALRSTISTKKIKALQENGLDRVYDAVAEEISKMNRKREEYIEKLTNGII